MRLTQLSESERFRFGVAFQIAVATLTGIRLVIIDSADILDTKRRKHLSGLLLQSELDQAIVLTTGAEQPSQAVPDDVKFFSLPDVQQQAKVHSVESISPRIDPHSLEPAATIG